MNLLAGEDNWDCVMISGADLRKDLPGLLFEESFEETLQTGDSLPDRLGLPLLFEFKEEKVIPHLLLGKRLRVATEVALKEV